MEYEWKQWGSNKVGKGMKKLHAVKWWDRISNYISACGISQPFDFIEPPKTQDRCKHCERELDGK